PLNAEGAKIEGKATLCDDFQIDGCVNFANSEITRQLDLRGFTPSNRASIDLRSAKAGVVRDDKANWLPSRKALLDGFSYERIHVEGILKAADWVKRLHPQRPERKKPFLRRSYKQIITLLRRIKQWL